MIVMFLILFLAITTQSSVLHYNLSNNDYSIKLLCMKCIMFCKFIGGETMHRRCLVIEYVAALQIPGSAHKHKHYSNFL